MKRLLSILVLIGLAGVHLQAQDTLRTFTFASNDMTGITYGVSGALTSTDMIGGVYTDAHAYSYAYSYWNRIADSAALYNSSFSTTYPYIDEYMAYYKNYLCSYLPSINDGFMLASMIDYNYYNYSTNQNQRFNVYLGFPAVTIPAATQVVEVAWRQLYRKYYDQCFVDYKVSGQWQTMEVNVTGVDVSVNAFGTLDAHYTLPLAAAQESSLELRLRYYSYGRGSAYGYCWAVDDFMVISGASNQWQVAPEHFVDGKYDVIPQGMQIPLTWYNAVKNTGAYTQTGVSVTMQHISPTGATSTFIDEDMPSLTNHGEYDTLVVDPRGFYSNASANWVMDGPNYGTSLFATVGNNGLPTADAGLNRVQTTVASDSLFHTYTERTYTVSTADDTGCYAWGYGNGVLAGGTEGFCYGYTSNGYITNSPTDSYYYRAGNRVLALLTTGNTLPVDNEGQPWVFRGMEMVVAPTCSNIEGTELIPILWKCEGDAENGWYTTVVATGTNIYTVTSGDYTPLDTGYLMPGQYNTLRIMFPTQPVLEPNTAYFLGYELSNTSEFALAVNRNSYVCNGNGEFRMFSEDSMLAPYAKSKNFPLGFGDVLTYSYNPNNGNSSYIYSGWNIDETPMMRALVGPAVEMPKAVVTINAATGAEVYSETNYQYYTGNATDSVVIGGAATYYISPVEGYQISDILIDGVSIYATADYNVYQGMMYIYDNSYNITDGYYYDYYQYTFNNINANHSIVVTTTPVSQHSVTFNCPSSHATVLAYLDDGTEIPACGTHSYYANTIYYDFVLESGYTIDSLMVDGALVDLNGYYGYTLQMGSNNHTLSLSIKTLECGITEFPYTCGFESGDHVESCWTYDEDEWMIYTYDNSLTHSGSGTMISFSGSFDDYGNYYSLNPDNWLLSPSIQLPANQGAILKWYASAYYDYENYSVYVYTTDNNGNVTYTFLGDYYAWGNYYDVNYTQQEIDLSAYAGQTVGIAFRHTGGNYVLFLDDMSIEVGVNVSVQCTGNGYGSTYRSGEYNNDRCYTTEILPTGFLASYDFIPGDGCDLAHLYVNNVDRMADVITHSSGTSVSMYSFSFIVDSATVINPVFNYPSYDITFNCTGTGEGSVYNTGTWNGDLCGDVDQVRQGFYASYEFYPYNHSELSHLYVNNVDRIGDAIAHSYGSWSSTADYYSYGFYVYGPVTVEPVFSALPITVTATSNNTSMGMVTGGGTYYYDSLVTITATPMPHYELLYWIVIEEYDTTVITQSLIDSLEIDFSFNPLQFYAYDDIEIIAVFGPESYTITVAPNNVLYGSVEGGGTFQYLESVTVSATAYSGYHFTMWSNGNNHNPYTFPATENLDLMAIFVSDDDTSQYFYISVNANNPTMGEVDGEGMYTMGDTAILTATPYEGYRFVQWQDGNTDNPRLVLVTSSADFIAYFAEGVGINDIDIRDANVYSQGRRIFVAGAEGRNVRLFDIGGRQLSQVERANGTLLFDVYHTGVYLVTVDTVVYRVLVR